MNKISVVSAVYNAGEGLAELVKRLQFYLRKNGIVMYELFTDNSEKMYRKLDFIKQ